MRSAALRVSGGARAKASRRSGGACEACGLQWPWNLYVFLRDETGRPVAENLEVLCAACSATRSGLFAPLLPQPTLRERMRESNNRRAGAVKLTAARRRRLVEARGSMCEICGVPGSVRDLEVHHRVAVLRGGSDDESNLLVLCFACHHRLQPCATGCGGWAKKPRRLCRHCEMRRRLEEVYAGQSWEQIKLRVPSLARDWPPGYEPLAYSGPLPSPPDYSAAGRARSRRWRRP